MKAQFDAERFIEDVCPVRRRALGQTFDLRLRPRNERAALPVHTLRSVPWFSRSDAERFNWNNLIA